MKYYHDHACATTCSILSAILSGLFLCGSVATTANSQGLIFLTTPNTPRAVAMGSATSTLSDPVAPMYNPGAMGVYHLEKIWTLSIPSSMEWFPDLVDDMDLSSWGTSLGWARSTFSGEKTPAWNYGLSIGYSQQKFEYGGITVTDETGHQLASYYPFDRSRNYSIAAGVAYRQAVYLGVGYTYRDLYVKNLVVGSGLVVEEAETDGSASDYGLLLCASLRNLLRPPSVSASVSPAPGFTFDLQPSFGFVIANSGDDMAYIDLLQDDHLPKTRHVGAGLLLTVYSKRQPIASARFVSDWEKLIAEGSDADAIKEKGIELGAFGTFFLRYGWIREHPVYGEISSYGAGLSLRGALNWFHITDDIRPQNSIMRRVIESFDMSLDYSKYVDDTSNVWDDRETFQITITI